MKSLEMLYYFKYDEKWLKVFTSKFGQHSDATYLCRVGPISIFETTVMISDRLKLLKLKTNLFMR